MQFDYGLTSNDVLSALQSAHRASDEYYTLRDFVIPQEAIAVDSELFREFGYDFTRMCQHKLSQLASNKISISRISSIFGAAGDKVSLVLINAISYY